MAFPRFSEHATSKLPATTVRTLVSVLVATGLLAASPIVANAGPSGGAVGAPAQLWGVQVRSGSAYVLGRSAGRLLLTHRVNALLVGPLGLNRQALAAVGKAAKRDHLLLVVERTAPRKVTGGPVCGMKLLQMLGLPAPEVECAFKARSTKAALALASKLTPDLLVVAPLRRPSELRALRTASTAHARVVGVTPLVPPRSKSRAPQLATIFWGAAPGFSNTEWHQAIVLAANAESLDLAVSPPTASPGPALGSYLQLLSSTLATFAAAPAAVTTPTDLVVTVAAVTAASATLAWAPSVDDSGTVTYLLYRDSQQIASAVSSPATIDLECGTQYQLGVQAVDPSGNRSKISTVPVLTAPCPPAPAAPLAPAPPPGGGTPADTTPPSQPAGVSASGVSQTAVTLSWSASSDNVGVAGYDLYRNGAKVGMSGTTSYLFSALSCGTSYTLAVDAYDAAGNASPRASITQSATTCSGGGDTSPPSAPAGLAASSVSQTAVTLSWSASSDDVGVAGYDLYANGSKVGTSGSTSYTYAGLSCGTSYTLAVDAYDATGNVSASSSVTQSTSACGGGDTSPPSRPGNLSTSGASQSTITLSWSTSTDNVGVAGYDLYRNGAKVATSRATSYTFSALSCGTSYTLAVDAYDASANVSPSSSLSASTAACPDTSPPSKPTGLSTSGVSQTAITLSWTGSSDNVGVTGYRLFQGGGQVGTSTSTSYLYSGLACGTSYTLGVAAIDGAGNVSSTATINASTAPCSGGVSANGYVSTTGNDSTCVRGDQSKPCLSFNKAYTLASCGDTVEIAGGSYGSQTIGYNEAQAACGSQIQFVVANGATVTITGNLGFNGARHVSVVSPSQVNFAVSGDLDLWPSSSSQYPVDITVSYIDFGERYEIQSTDTATISHNDFGPALTSPTDNNEPEFWYNTSGAPNNTGITFAFNTVHDFTSSGDAHTSCGLVSYLTNSTIRGNVFARCDNEDLLVKSGGSGGGEPSGSFLQNITIEDNSFAAACGSCGVGDDAGLSVNVGVQGGPGTPYSGFVIRGNSFHDPVSFNQGNSTTFTASFFTGNILPRTADETTGTTCALGLTSAYNVFVAGPACGMNTILASVYPYISATDVIATLNYGLSGAIGSTVADNAVPMSVAGGCSPVDIDGTARPIGGSCDAGSDER